MSKEMFNMLGKNKKLNEIKNVKDTCPNIPIDVKSIMEARK